MTSTVKTKRAYDKPDDSDGFRILVDGMWPRGISGNAAGIDVWLKNIAPSSGLRKWFGHDPEKWESFKKKYFQELDQKTEEIKTLKEHLSGNDIVTFVYAAKDTRHNNAEALRQYMENLQA